MMQELEKDNEIPTQLPNEHELEIPFDLENNEEEDDDEGKEENDSRYMQTVSGRNKSK